MKVRITVPQTGLYNGAEWPAVGSTVDLPAHVAEGMIAAGHVEDAKNKPPADESDEAPGEVETRPASTEGVETRGAAKKSASKS